MDKLRSFLFPLFEETVSQYKGCSFRQKKWLLLEKFQHEDMKKNHPYLSVRDLFSSDAKLGKREKLKKRKIFSGLFFSDGFFYPAFSSLPKGMQVTFSKKNPLKEDSYTQKNEFFPLLNDIFHPEKIVIRIEKKTKLKKPIPLIFSFSSQARKKLLFPKIVIILEEQAQAEFHVFIKKDQRELFCNFIPSIQVIVKEKAKLYWKCCFDHFFSSCCFDLYHFLLFENASLQFLDFSSSNHLRYLQGWVDLLGEKAKVKIQSLSLLSKIEQTHLNFFINHKAKSTISSQKNRSILLDESKYSVKSDVYISSCAEESDSSQINHNLLLSEKAFSYSQPNLRIFNDKVKAKHGASISQIKEEDIFYLASRGIPLLQAKKLLMEAFAKEIFDFTEDNWVKEKIEKNITSYLNRFFD